MSIYQNVGVYVGMGLYKSMGFCARLYGTRTVVIIARDHRGVESRVNGVASRCWLSGGIGTVHFDPASINDE
jgi:hypothetical protein